MWVKCTKSGNDGKGKGAQHVVATHNHVVVARAAAEQLSFGWLSSATSSSSHHQVCLRAGCYNKPNCCVARVKGRCQTNNAPTQRAGEHSNTVVGEKIPTTGQS